jgi:acetyl esterase
METAKGLTRNMGNPNESQEPHPQTAKVLEQMRRNAAGKPPYSALTPQQYRERFARDRAVNPDPAPVARIEDIRVPVGKGREMPVRLYAARPASTPQPVFVYLHGGGWIGGSVDTHDHVARQLALATPGVIVASLDYPLAPEDPFPEPHRQTAEVLLWMRTNGARIGADGARLAIGGDSAGANISLCALLALCDAGETPASFGVLIYGSYSPIERFESHRVLGDGRFGLTGTSLDYYWNHYFGTDPAVRRDPLAAPLSAPLAGLPPLMLTCAGLDPVRDETRVLASRLALAGQPFSFREYQGLVHGYMHYYAEIEPAAGAIRDVGAALRTHLAPGGQSG